MRSVSRQPIKPASTSESRLDASPTSFSVVGGHITTGSRTVISSLDQPHSRANPTPTATSVPALPDGSRTTDQTRLHHSTITSFPSQTTLFLSTISPSNTSLESRTATHTRESSGLSIPLKVLPGEVQKTRNSDSASATSTLSPQSTSTSKVSTDQSNPSKTVLSVSSTLSTVVPPPVSTSSVSVSSITSSSVSPDGLKTASHIRVHHSTITPISQQTTFPALSSNTSLGTTASTRPEQSTGLPVPLKTSPGEVQKTRSSVTASPTPTLTKQFTYTVKVLPDRPSFSRPQGLSTTQPSKTQSSVFAVPSPITPSSFSASGISMFSPTFITTTKSVQTSKPSEGNPIQSIAHVRIPIVTSLPLFGKYKSSHTVDAPPNATAMTLQPPSPGPSDTNPSSPIVSVSVIGLSGPPGLPGNTQSSSIVETSSSRNQSSLTSTTTSSTSADTKSSGTHAVGPAPPPSPTNNRSTSLTTLAPIGIASPPAQVPGHSVPQPTVNQTSSSALTANVPASTPPPPQPPTSASDSSAPSQVTHGADPPQGQTESSQGQLSSSSAQPTITSVATSTSLSNIATNTKLNLVISSTPPVHPTSGLPSGGQFKDSTATTTSSSSPWFGPTNNNRGSYKHDNNSAAIIGGTVAATVSVITLIIVVVFLICRRQRRRRQITGHQFSGDLMQVAPVPGIHYLPVYSVGDAPPHHQVIFLPESKTESHTLEPNQAEKSGADDIFAQLGQMESAIQQKSASNTFGYHIYGEDGNSVYKSHSKQSSASSSDYESAPAEPLPIIYTRHDPKVTSMRRVGSTASIATLSDADSIRSSQYGIAM